jgi:hypothetical protein
VQADVAQLVEQSIRNRQVIGSSPIVGSKYLCRVAPPRSRFSFSFSESCSCSSARGRPRGLFLIVLQRTVGLLSVGLLSAVEHSFALLLLRSGELANDGLTKPLRFPHFAEISSCYLCLVLRIIFCT